MPNGFTHNVDPEQAARTATHKLFASSPVFVLVPSQNQTSETCQQTVLDPEVRGRGVDRFICSSRVVASQTFFVE
jgi:hypothetical protein